MIYNVTTDEGFVATYGSKDAALNFAYEYIISAYPRSQQEKVLNQVESREYKHGIFVSGPDAVVVKITIDNIM